MDLQVILTAISSVGFPIVACGAMAYFFAKVNDNYRNDIKEINKSHKEEMDAMTQAITNNTIAIQKLVDMINKEE